MDNDYTFLKKKSIQLKEKVSNLLKKKKNQKDENEIRYFVKLLEEITDKMEIIINSKY